MVLARWLVVLLSLGYAVGAAYYYNCRIKQIWCYAGAPADRPPAAVAAAAPEDERPAVFGYGYPQPQLRPATWPAHRDSVLAALPPGQTLEIVGFYYADERPPEGFANMGMARAAALRRAIGDHLSEERILLAGRRLPAPDAARNGLYALSEFNYLAAEARAEVIELPDRIVIYFPAARAEGLLDSTVTTYLDRLTGQLELTGQRVRLVGHTDSDGSEALNLQLGTQRANTVRDVLLRKGLPPGRLTVESRGETDPVADNGSPVGKQRNRRVEVQLID